MLIIITIVHIELEILSVSLDCGLSTKLVFCVHMKWSYVIIPSVFYSIRVGASLPIYIYSETTYRRNTAMQTYVLMKLLILILYYTSSGSFA